MRYGFLIHIHKSGEQIGNNISEEGEKIVGECHAQSPYIVLDTGDTYEQILQKIDPKNRGLKPEYIILLHF